MITWICSAVSDPDDQEFLIELYEEFHALMFSVARRYNNNWMSTGLNEWTISRYSDASDFAFGIAYDGGVGYVNVDFDLGRVVRPSFNLTSSVKYDSGDGTAVNPIQLKI